MVSGLRDLDQCIVVGVAFGVRGEQQLGVSHDHGEQVVEVVSHAACQAAEGIHLLRLAQLLLKLQTLLLGAPAFADVADVCGEERTARKLASADRDLHQEGVSVRSKPGHLFPVPRLGRAPAGQETGDRRPTRAPRLRQREQLADGLPDRRLLRVSKDGLDGRVAFNDASVAAHRHDDVESRAEDRALGGVARAAAGVR